MVWALDRLLCNERHSEGDSTISRNWLALGGTVASLSVRPQACKHQNKKVCLTHLALTISEPLGGLWCKAPHFRDFFTACLWFVFLGCTMIMTSENLSPTHLLSSFQNLCYCPHSHSFSLNIRHLRKFP